MSISRRKFLNANAKLLAAAGMTAIAPLPFFSANRQKPLYTSVKIKRGLIGAKNRGLVNLKNALKQPGVECIELCDVVENILAQCSADVEKIQGTTPTKYKDYRKLLENKDIDAVIIGTPDHWHCLPFIYACEMGKDVYVEKHLANNIADCNIMVQAARKYNRVVQVGQQQRSGNHFSGNFGSNTVENALITPVYR